MAAIPKVEKTKENLLEIYELCIPWKAAKASDVGKEPNEHQRMQRMAAFLKSKNIEGRFDPDRWEEYIVAISKHEPCPICGYAMRPYGLSTMTVKAQSSWSCGLSKWHTTAMNGAELQINNMVKHITDEDEREKAKGEFDQVVLACDSLCIHSLPPSVCDDPECRIQAIESERRSENNYREYCKEIGALAPA